MQLPIKAPRRSRHLVQRDIVNALGGYKVTAALCLVAPVTVSKWMEDPDGSGQDITVRHLQSLLTQAGENLSNLALQNAIDELLGEHFLNLCHRIAYPQEQVVLFLEMLQGHKAAEKAANE